MSNFQNHTCPLCSQSNTSLYHQDKVRSYLSCETCNLVFVPTAQHISTSRENAYYDLHDNQPDDSGYRDFLERLFIPLNQRLAPNSRGLDFGSGPGPTLSIMFEEAGHSVAIYDPYYASDIDVLSAQYDFITMSEVIEHLAEPGKEMDRLWNCLNSGGWLGIMTKRIKDQEAFKSWHYITDPTHISYFSEATFGWLLNHFSIKGAQATLTITGNDVVLIKKG